MEHVKTEYGQLTALINNACQTIRRPPAYYAPQMAIERAPPPPAMTALLANHGSFQATLARLPSPALDSPVLRPARLGFCHFHCCGGILHQACEDYAK